MPDFIRGRLEKITTMIDMVEDAEWKLPDEETARVLNALAYFSEPEDLIPDHVPGLGFLDDAIMVELVCRELRHGQDFGSLLHQRACQRRRTRAGSRRSPFSLF